MLMITAVIQPFRVEHVREALISAGLLGLTINECLGHGRQPTFVPSRHCGPDIADILPKVKVEIAVPDDLQETAIAAIIRGARLGNIGDGKIFVSHLDRVVSIGTGLEDGMAHEFHAPMVEAAE